MEQSETVAAKPGVNTLLKMTLEIGPLAVFFIANAMKGISFATAALMAATAIALVASRILTKRIPVMPLVSGIFVLVFGALTLYLQDATFMYIKPTILNLLFASALAGGLMFRKLLLKIVFGEALQMQDEGWRVLTVRWTVFFIFLAIVNEIVWRNFSESAWVTYKSFGVMPLTFLFMMAQLSLIMKYRLPDMAPGDNKITPV